VRDFLDCRQTAAKNPDVHPLIVSIIGAQTPLTLHGGCRDLLQGNAWFTKCIGIEMQQWIKQRAACGHNELYLDATVIATFLLFDGFMNTSASQIASL
jgi:hypothetical protein